MLQARKILDADRDRPVINGVQLAQSQSQDVVVQDYKKKMLDFAPIKEEREVVNILMSQVHLAIPGGFLVGNPPELPLGEALQGSSFFTRKPDLTSDDVRYTLNRNKKLRGGLLNAIRRTYALGLWPNIPAFVSKLRQKRPQSGGAMKQACVLTIKFDMY